MTDKQELQLREKKELKHEGEPTREGPLFNPDVDIYESERALMLLADVPGATADGLELDLRDNVLTLTANVTHVESKWRPIYSEYNVGHYTRQFRIGQQVDREKISAQLKDGVLALTLPKVEKAMPRKIPVS